MRLTPLAFSLGLASQERYDLMEEKRRLRDALIELARTLSVKAADVDAILEAKGSTPLRQGVKLIDVILRPGISFADVAPALPELQALIETFPADRREEITEAAEILVKYQGYIDRERANADKVRRLEDISLVGKFDYESIHALSTEARQKLARIQPQSIAQASRIPGVSPADINILLLLLGR